MCISQFVSHQTAPGPPMSMEDDMRAIAERHGTISDKIRALAVAGYSKAQTARFLRRSYTQVRNVLKQDEIRGRTPTTPPDPAGVQEGGATYVPRTATGDHPFYRLGVGLHGEVVLPPDALQAMGWSPGGVIIADVESDRLVLLSTRASVERVQRLVRELLPHATNMADELIADRRREADAEFGGG